MIEYIQVCNYENPFMVSMAKHERAQMAKAARSEDEYLAAGESTWEEFIPPCDCDKCKLLEQEYPQ